MGNIYVVFLLSRNSLRYAYSSFFGLVDCQFIHSYHGIITAICCSPQLFIHKVFTFTQSL